MTSHEGHGEVTLSLTRECPDGSQVHQSWVICACYEPGLRARLGPPQHESVATRDAVEAITRTMLGQAGNIVVSEDP